MNVPVLMIGYGTDPPLRHLMERARLLGTNFEVFDLLSLRDAKNVRISQTPEDLVIEMDGRAIQFSGFHSFYNRCDYADFGDPFRNLMSWRIYASISACLEFCRATVVNRASAGSPNVNKFLHTVELRDWGFRTPAK